MTLFGGASLFKRWRGHADAHRMGPIRRLAAPASAVLVAAVFAPAAHAATVSSDGSTVRIAAAPGEQNSVEVERDDLAGTLTVRDTATPPGPAGLCGPSLDTDAVTCPVPRRIDADLGDQADAFADYTDLPDAIRPGSGDDTLFCGEGRDTVRAAQVEDEIDLTCESVDYGRAGQVGPIRVRTGGGRFVAVPGQRGTKVDRRILPDVLYLVRRYHLRLGDGYKVGGNHKAKGEHPLGLGLDIYPGAGGGWNAVDRLARWAEPRQNRPRMPFRWVGYNGDYNHGRGNHLHLSWSHSAGRPGRPVRSVWTWSVSP